MMEMANAALWAMGDGSRPDITDHFVAPSRTVYIGKINKRDHAASESIVPL